MNNKIKNYIKSDSFMYVFFGIYMMILLINNTSLFLSNDILLVCMKIIRYICYIVFGIRIIIDWKNGSNITLTIILLTILSILIFLVAHNKNVFLLLIFLISLRKLDFDKLIKITFNIFIFIFLITISLSLMGIIPDWIFYRGSIVRHSLGFVYATDAIGIYLSIIIMYFYIRKSKATYIELMILETINIFLYKFTDGRLSFILVSIILGIMLLSKFKFVKKLYNYFMNKKVFKILCCTLPIILFLMFNFITLLYTNNNSFAIRVNELLSNRLKYTSEAYKEYGVTLFGEQIEWNGWGGHGYIDTDEMESFNYNYVDSSYARVMLDYGIVFCSIVLLGYTFTLTHNYDKNKWLIFSLLFICIWSFVEQHLVNIGRNIFVISLLPLIEIGNIKLLSYTSIKNKIRGRKNEKISS